MMSGRTATPIGAGRSQNSTRPAGPSTRRRSSSRCDHLTEQENRAGPRRSVGRARLRRRAPTATSASTSSGSPGAIAAASAASAAGSSARGVRRPRQDRAGWHAAAVLRACPPCPCLAWRRTRAALAAGMPRRGTRPARARPRGCAPRRAAAAAVRTATHSSRPRPRSVAQARTRSPRSARAMPHASSVSSSRAATIALPTWCRPRSAERTRRTCAAASPAQHGLAVVHRDVSRSRSSATDDATRPRSAACSRPRAARRRGASPTTTGMPA